MRENRTVEPCCFIGEAGDERPACRLDAAWQIDGPDEDDQKFSCSSHIGDLLSDAPVYVVAPIRIER